jgi:hypothetical protein
MHNGDMKSIKLSRMGGSGKTLATGLAGFIARGQQAQKAADEIIDAYHAKQARPKQSQPKE